MLLEQRCFRWPTTQVPNYECLLKRTIMKPFNFKSTRLEIFCALLILGGVFYVVDCLIVNGGEISCGSGDNVGRDP